MGCCQSAHSAGAGSDGCSCCEPLERVNYFPRQLLTADDMRAEQEYFRAKQRRQNQMLFGRGVVCGLDVKLKSENEAGSANLVICPGYALSPKGDEIAVCDPFELDLRRCVRPKVPDCEPAAVAPVAAENPDKPDIHFVVIRPIECKVRPVRTLPDTCGCDESACEYSRVRESFEVSCLKTLPSSHATWCPPSTSVLKQAGVESLLPEHGAANSVLSALADRNILSGLLGSLSSACSPCPKDDWVVLAAVSIQDGSVTQVDNTVRRWVVTVPTLLERLGCLTQTA